MKRTNRARNYPCRQAKFHSEAPKQTSFTHLFSILFCFFTFSNVDNIPDILSSSALATRCFESSKKKERRIPCYLSCVGPLLSTWLLSSSWAGVRRLNARNLMHVPPDCSAYEMMRLSPNNNKKKADKTHSYFIYIASHEKAAHYRRWSYYIILSTTLIYNFVWAEANFACHAR